MIEACCSDHKYKMNDSTIVPWELTYEFRWLSAASASSSEAIVTNANPLFLLLLYIDSWTKKQGVSDNNLVPVK